MTAPATGRGAITTTKPSSYITTATTGHSAALDKPCLKRDEVRHSVQLESLDATARTCWRWRGMAPGSFSGPTLHVIGSIAPCAEPRWRLTDKAQGKQVLRTC